MIKKIALTAILVGALGLAGCGKPLTIDGKTYDTVGLISAPTKQSTKICYEVSVGNVFWSIVLIETIFMPVYFIGFSIYNPVRVKTGPDDTCGAQ